jgi:hypothetical protein
MPAAAPVLAEPNRAKVPPPVPVPPPKPQERNVDEFFNPAGNSRIALISS